MKAKLCYLLLFSFSLVKAQPHQQFAIDTPVKFIETDILDNLYIVTPRNIILKYDSLGKLLATQQFRSYGDITTLDASNPLNPEIFFSGRNTVLITDNLLNTVSEITLEESMVQQFITGCRASAGGFWFYDASDGKLKMLDPAKQQKIESPNLASVGIRDLNPVYMREYLPWIYISIPSKGVVIFDQFGAYNKTVPLKDIQHFQVLKNTIVCFKDNRLNYHDIETNEQKAVTLPFFTPGVQDVKISRRRYWIQTAGGVKVFTE